MIATAASTPSSARRRSPNADARACIASSVVDALFVWSAIHGLASILGNDTAYALALQAVPMDETIANHMVRVRKALQPPCAC
jgi:hypothetical protein